MNANALPSWADSPRKTAILDFIANTTSSNSKHFLPVEDRIAVFDNDGTLWVEKPINTEVAFFKDLLLKHPDNQPEHHGILGKLEHAFEHKAMELLNDIEQLAGYLFKGLSIDEFNAVIMNWLSHAKHPRFHTLYTNLAYKPMQEVLALFHQHQFVCYIVSGGTADFIRPWSPMVYKIQPPQVIGSSLKTHVDYHDSRMVLELEPIPFYFDNGPAKVRSINRIIGKVPAAAFGNSHGDVEMLTWAGQNPGSLAMLIHHTDAEREYEYSPDPIWHLGKSTLTLASDRQWQVMDMKTDWLTVFNSVKQ